MSKSKEVAIVSKDNFPAVNMDKERLGMLMQENIGDDEFTKFDLDKITVPSGGLTVWSVQTLEGKKNVEELVGVIVGEQKGRAYWKNSSQPDGTPPDCSSEDGIIGTGDPGGYCQTCPFNEFKSHENGRAKACGEKTSLFVLLPGNILPVVVQVPPKSRTNLKKYKGRLINGNNLVHEIATRFTLKETKDNGMTYSVIEFEMAEKLPAEMADAIANYRRSFMEAFGKNSTGQTPFTGGNGNRPSADDPSFDEPLNTEQAAETSA